MHYSAATKAIHESISLLSDHFSSYVAILVAGDAQSVSALADLAKQAQVFNLQNWLHSAEASSGSSTSLCSPLAVIFCCQAFYSLVPELSICDA